MNRTELASVVVIAASALVIAANLFRGTDNAPPPTPAPEAEEDQRERITKIEAELLAIRSRCADLESRAVVTPAPPEEPEEIVAAPRSPAGTAPAEIPEAIRRSAELLGVAEDALRAAFDLEMSVRERRPTDGLFERFAAFGDQGFLAMLAVIRGGLRATWQRGFLEKTYRPGLERHLLDLAEDPNCPKSHPIALSFLSLADTEQVRTYLVKRLERETGAAVILAAAESLGRLKEPRGAAPLEGKFVGDGFSGVRPLILDSLGQMGGEDARRILIGYLRDEHADQIARAAGALNRVDPEATSIEARRILAGPRAKFLSKRTQSALQKYAEE